MKENTLLIAIFLTTAAILVLSSILSFQPQTETPDLQEAHKGELHPQNAEEDNVETIMRHDVRKDLEWTTEPIKKWDGRVILRETIPE